MIVWKAHPYLTEKALGRAQWLRNALMSGEAPGSEALERIMSCVLGLSQDAEMTVVS